jgi:hypothetical protein
LIPSTLLGVLVFGASIGPGYVFLRISEPRRYRPNRSALLETAELVSVGGFTSIIALLIALLVAGRSGWFDIHSFGANDRVYASAHPVRCLSFLLATLALSYLIAIAAARFIERKRAPSITPEPTWLHILGDQHLARTVTATVELRDGRQFYGQVAVFSVEGEQLRQLALAAPIKVRVKGGDTFDKVDAERILLNARDILSVATRYQFVLPNKTSARQGRDSS